MNNFWEPNLINPDQHGFRKEYPRETQLFEFTTDLHASFDTSYSADIIYLDFGKAVGVVPHKRILLKFSAIKVDPVLLCGLSPSSLVDVNHFI